MKSVVTIAQVLAAIAWSVAFAVVLAAQTWFTCYGKGPFCRDVLPIQAAIIGVCAIGWALILWVGRWARRAIAERDADRRDGIM